MQKPSLGLSEALLEHGLDAFRESGGQRVGSSGADLSKLTFNRLPPRFLRNTVHERLARLVVGDASAEVSFGARQPTTTTAKLTL